MSERDRKAGSKDPPNRRRCDGFSVCWWATCALGLPGQHSGAKRGFPRAECVESTAARGREVLH